MWTIMDIVSTCWEHTGEACIDRFTAWRSHKIMCKYIQYQKTPVKFFPPRTRRLSISPEEGKPNAISSSERCRLLELPPEIRGLIWQQMFGGHLIALCRDGNQMTHCLVDDANSRVDDISEPVNVNAVKGELVRREQQVRGKLGRKKQRRPNTLNVLPALQSCRSIYSESINMLYSQNTFLFLQNDTFLDFSKSILPERLNSIRSMHIHFQLRELGPWRGAWGFNEVNLQSVVNVLLPPALGGSHPKSSSPLLPGCCPRLEHLSVFIQGPLWLGTTVEALIEQLTLVAVTRGSSLKSFIVRLPRHMNDAWFGNQWGGDIDQMVANPDLLFKIVRPEFTIGRLEDQDTGLDVGWRMGEVLFPKKEPDSEDEFEVRRYTVWTPTPKGLSWPCHKNRL